MFMTIFLLALLRRKIFFQTKVVEKIETRNLFSIALFFLNHAIYEIMWKYMVEPSRSQMTV